MKLTANQKRAIRRLWKGDLTTEEICEEMQFTGNQLDEARTSLGLPEREEPDTYLPSPLQIKIECAKIRETWSESTREQRIAHQSLRYSLE